jgi:hypothetical protein
MNKTEQLAETTKRELEEWLQSPNAEESFYLTPLQKIKAMSEEEIILKSIANRFETLGNWYVSNFVYASLHSGNQSDYAVQLATNSYQILALKRALSKQYSNNPPSLMFNYSAYYLANIVIAKWYKEAEAMVLFLNQALETKTLNGGLDFKMTAWFILEIVNKGFNVDYDYSKFNYPGDMGIYRKALDNWNTNDLNLLDEIVSDLCEFHLSQASYGSLSDSAGKMDPMFIQFSNTSWFVYAFEILAWLAMREQQGLRNPDAFTHPLMNMPLNQLTEDSIKLPEDELFNKIMCKIQ